jgi:hypothetical protein
LVAERSEDEVKAETAGIRFKGLRTAGRPVGTSLTTRRVDVSLSSADLLSVLRADQALEDR